MIAPPEEDPNATITCNSPPCFMHELDPAYLGYLGRHEVATLLEDLLAAEWFGTWLETARLRAMLRRHLGRLGEAPTAKPGGDARDPAAASPDGGQDRLTRRVRAALPRLHDDALRRDLADLLGMMDRDVLRRRRDPV
ncbi:hypothetical protein E2C06_19105 [Dankookia rubra]|uniref:Uncharacterized protein n=1 Tax=Dankookia rubra TaxID=1442381 RepID=A0A4R5QCV3_9PROT|nr:hypothetical protein [Dankookia rubra]TDH60964.1 hypothetical protein E2C06_19105 [Dankookia rubra]